MTGAATSIWRFGAGSLPVAGFIGNPVIWIEWLLSTLFDSLGNLGQCTGFLPVRLAGDGFRPSIAGLFGRAFQLVDDVPNDISQQAHSFFPSTHSSTISKSGVRRYE